MIDLERYRALFPIISQHVLNLGAFLINDLREHGYTVRASRDYRHHSSIVVVETSEPHRAQRRLAAANVIAAVHSGGLRFAPHFYNTEADAVRVGDALGRIR